MKTNRSTCPNTSPACGNALNPKYLFLLLFLANLVFSQTVDTTWYTDDQNISEFTITKAEELAGLARLVNGHEDNGTYNMNGKTIKLGNDIALAGNWTAIGSYANPFSGTFDGSSYVISNVYINSEHAQYQGLFGNVLGTIKNLGVVSSYVKGSNFIGIVAGFLGESNGLKGSVINSYAIGETEGYSSIGGLVGESNRGIISNSYAVATVSGSSFSGKLVGYNNGGTISSSYYNSQITGSGLTGNDGTGKTTAEMQSDEFVFALNLGAASLSMNVWEKTDAYPALSSQIASDEIADYIKSGAGTEEAPYIITTKEELAYLAVFVNSGNSFEGGHFKLGNNIELNENSETEWQNWANQAPGYAWSPIGNYDSWDSDNDREIANPFSGTFDGAGYVVSGVYINTNSSYKGLFGYINGGTIKNLGVVNSYIKGGSHTGGLLGYSNGVIISSYANANVSGSSYTGGLVGLTDGSTISNSYATGTVSGSSYVGGLVGYNGEWNTSAISNSYATGAVSGSSSTGGLVGYNGGNGVWGADGTGIIINCYSTGEVSGSGSSLGGLVGAIYTASRSTITSSFYDSETSTRDDDKGTPKSTEDMKNSATFVLSGWDFNIWAIDPEINNGYPFHGTAALPSIAEALVEFNNQRLTESGTPTTLIYAGNSSLEATLKSVVLGETELVEGTDYQVFYGDNSELGIAKIAIIGIGNYSGAVVLDYFIAESRNLNTVTVNPIPDQLWTGEDIKPEIVVKGDFYGVTIILAENIDYLVEDCSTCKDEGTAKINLYTSSTGIYSGIKAVTFEIVGSKNLEDKGSVIFANSADITLIYNGKPQTPSVIVSHIYDGELEEGKDYRLSYSDNINVGLGKATVEGIGDYSGELSINFEIVPQSIENNENIYIGSIEPQIYSGGNAITPLLAIADLERNAELVLDVDYIVTYLNNKNVSTDASQAVVYIEGIGNYSGETQTYFIIVSSEADIVRIPVEWLGPFEFTYDGTEKKPSARAELDNGDAINLIIIGGNINAGVHTATATTNTGYPLSNATVEFTINAKQLAEDAIEPIGDILATGSQLTPSVVVKDGTAILVEGTDYEISYGANKTAGENAGTVTVTGIGNYAGIATATFNIDENPEITEPIEDPDPCEEEPDSCNGTPIILPQIAGNQISVQAVSGGILLGNLPSNAKVEIFNLQGKQVYSAMSVDAQCIVPLQTKGMYIVKVGTQTFRAAVR